MPTLGQKINELSKKGHSKERIKEVMESKFGAPASRLTKDFWNTELSAIPSLLAPEQTTEALSMIGLGEQPPKPATPIVEPTKPEAPRRDAGASILAGGKVPKDILDKEHAMEASQIARPLGFAAGAATEVGKLGYQVLAGGLEAVGELFDVAVHKPLGLKSTAPSKRSAEAYQRKIAKGLGLSPAEIKPQASIQVEKQYGGKHSAYGANKDELLKRKNKDLYQLMQEDAEEALVGTLQAIFTDIIPIVPSKKGESWEGAFIEAAKRGEALPASMVAFGPIFADAAGYVAEGDFDGAVRVLASRPATLALTLLPFKGKIKSPKLRAWVERTAKAAKETKFATAAVKAAKPVTEPLGKGYAKMQRAVSDPLIQDTKAQSAKAERIFEESRATREKAAGAIDILSKDEVKGVKAPETEPGYITDYNKIYTDILRSNSEYMRLLHEERLGRLTPEIAEKMNRVEQAAKTKANERLAKEPLEQPTFDEKGIQYKVSESYESGVSERGITETVAGVPEHVLADMERLHDVMREEMRLSSDSSINVYESLKTKEGVPGDIARNIAKNPVHEALFKEQLHALHQEPRYIEGTRIKEVPKEVIASIEDSFKASYTFDMPSEQLTPKIRSIIADGAAKILEQDPLSFVQDRNLRQKYAEYIFDNFIPEKKGIDKKILVKSIARRLEDFVYDREVSRADSFKLPGGKVISREQLHSGVKDFLNIEGEGSFKAEVREHVQAKVKKEVFKESLRNNIQHETGGLHPNGNPMLSAKQVAADITTRSARDGTPPPAIYAGEGLQTIEAVMENLIENGDANSARTIGEYVKPSPELAGLVGENVYISPSFNASFTTIIRTLDAVDKSPWAVSMAKRSFTSRNAKSAGNNFKANVILYNMYYGAIEGISATAHSLFNGASELGKALGSDRIAQTAARIPDAVGTDSINAFKRYAAKKPATPQEALIFETMHNTGIFDNTLISNEVSMFDKGGFFVGVAEKLGKPGKLVGRTGKKLNAIQDAAYTFGDNYFKFLSTYIETADALKSLDVLEGAFEASSKGLSPNVKRVTLKYGDNLSVEVGKALDGNYYQLKKVGNEYKVGELLSKNGVPNRKLLGILTKGGARSAFAKFVDYERLPAIPAILRRNPGAGLASLFVTWGWKMMDIPGLKKGIVSHFLANEGIVIDTTSSSVSKRLMKEAVNRSATRALTLGLAKTAINEDQDGDVRRMLAYNKQGLVPMTYETSSVDPFSFVFKSENATNFFGPSETMARLLLGTGIAVAKTFEDKLQSSGITTKPMLVSDFKEAEDEEELMLSKEAGRIYRKWKSGQFISAKDTLGLAGIAGNPLFDFLDIAVESDNNPSIDLQYYATKTLKTVVMGGTLKSLTDATFKHVYTPQELIARKGLPFATTMFYDVYKKAEFYKYTPDSAQRLNNMARDIVNIPLGTAYRYAFAHKKLGKQDIGKFNRWTKDFSSRMDKSFAHQYKRRIEALARMGEPDDSPAMKIALERYVALKTANKLETAAFKLRVIKAIEKTGMYDD